MSQFEQKEVLFKHTTSRAEAVNTSSPDWQENVIYFVEDSSNKCGTIFLNGIPYTSTNVGFSEEVVGYTLQNVASGNYVVNEKYIYPNGHAINTTLVTNKANNGLELIKFSNGGDFAALPKNVKNKNNNITTVYTDMCWNANSINIGSTDMEFNLCLSVNSLPFKCMYAVDSYDSTDISQAQDVYYLWKHNQVGCGVLCENVNEKGVSYLDLYKTGDNGSQPFEARDGNPDVAFIWGLSAEERKKFQWIIKPAYSSKSQWHPQGDFNEQGTYKIDDLVSYNNALYLCIKDYDTTINNTSVIYPTDTTYWKEVFKATSSAYRGEYKYEKWGKYNTNDVVFVGTSIYICKDTYSMDDEGLSDPSNKIHWAEILRFPSSKTALQYRGEYDKGTSENPNSYNKNDIVDDQGTHYICLKDYKTPPEAFNNEDTFVPYLNTVAWRLKENSEIVLCGTVENLTGGTVVNEGEILRVNNTCYKCIKTHTPGPNVDLNNTEYWEPLSNTIYLSPDDAKAITADSIGNYTGKDVLYQINNKTYTDSRRFVYCNTYNYTGSSESVVNPYNSPYDTISLGLPYWKVFSITNTDNERYISYASLKDLVSRKLLNPFITYVLTDYLSKNYSGQGGRGSNFYIKLKALDNKTLSEYCTFAKDPNNNYFKQNNLEQWEGKYILNPSEVTTDSSHYQHIGGCNGTIIYLKDEFNNEGDYDFKHNFAFIDERKEPNEPRQIMDATLLSIVHDNKFFKYNNIIKLYSADAHHNNILLNNYISNITIRTNKASTGTYFSTAIINNINIDFSTGEILQLLGSNFDILLSGKKLAGDWVNITDINIYNSKFIETEATGQYSLTLYSNLNIVNSSIQGVRLLRDSDINNSALLINNLNEVPLSFNIKNSTFKNGGSPITISFNGDENQPPKITFSANGLNLQSNIVVNYNALDNITYKLDSSLQKLASDITIELPNGIDISDVVSNELIVYAPSDKRYLVINPFASKESISIQEQASIELDSYLGKNNKVGVILGFFYSQLQDRITSGSTGPYWYWKTGSVGEVVANLNSEQEFNYNLTIGSIEQGLRTSISNYMTRHNIVSKSISVDNVYVGELKIPGDTNYKFEHSITDYQRCTDNRMDNCGILFNYPDSDGITKEYCITNLHDCVNIIKNGILLAIGSRVTYYNDTGDAIITRKAVNNTGDNAAYQAYRRLISDYPTYRHSNNNAILENCNIITKDSLNLGSICEKIASDFDKAELCIWKKDDRGNWQPDVFSFNILFNGSDFSTLTLSE